jgi:hypothetical protein
VPELPRQSALRSHALVARATGTSLFRGVRRISLVWLCLGAPAVGFTQPS